MPRPKRISEPGFYHVYNRANNRRSVNLCNDTFEFFIGLIHTLNDTFGIKTYAYCLMRNHYHLLLETSAPNLSEGMKYFGEKYARHINEITNGSGPVFDARFKSKVISHERYLLQVLRYIHLNPIESGAIEALNNYQWSSYTEYLSPSQYRCINTHFFLEKFLREDDFINFHMMGNSPKLSAFYTNKKSAQRLVL